MSTPLSKSSRLVCAPFFPATNFRLASTRTSGRISGRASSFTVSDVPACCGSGWPSKASGIRALFRESSSTRSCGSQPGSESRPRRASAKAVRKPASVRGGAGGGVASCGNKGRRSSSALSTRTKAMCSAPGRACQFQRTLHAGRRSQRPWASYNSTPRANSKGNAPERWVMRARMANAAPSDPAALPCAAPRSGGAASRAALILSVSQPCTPSLRRATSAPAMASTHSNTHEARAQTARRSQFLRFFGDWPDWPDRPTLLGGPNAVPLPGVGEDGGAAALRS